MDTQTSFIIIAVSAIIFGLISGFVAKKGGYSFGMYLMTGTLAGAGLCALILKIIRDYL